MVVTRLRRSAPEAGSYAWTLVLPRPSRREKALQPGMMNASELMFFFGAPLAHIVAYEEHLKAARHEKAAKELARSRRAPGYTSQLAAERLPELAVAGPVHGS